MDVPAVPVKFPAYMAAVAIAVMAGAYLVFLWASWQQDQKDRATRDDKINEMLSRLPKPAEKVE